MPVIHQLLRFRAQQRKHHEPTFHILEKRSRRGHAYSLFQILVKRPSIQSRKLFNSDKASSDFPVVSITGTEKNIAAYLCRFWKKRLILIVTSMFEVHTEQTRSVSLVGF
jgi:hypothetical protein